MNKGWKKGLKIAGGVVVGVAAVAAAPFTGGGSILAGAATLGLGTAAAAGSAVLAGAAGGALVNEMTKDKPLIIKKGIFILGPQQVGKTTLYDYLQGKNNSSKQTSVNNYDEFTYKIDKDKSLIIRKGKDIGGGTEFIERFYEKMITDKEVDYGFFVFNAYEYLNNIEHRRDVNARLDFIYGKNILNKKTIIIGSYIDKFSNEEVDKVASKIKELTADKSYRTLLSGEYLHLLNLTNHESLKDFFKNIFNN